CPGDREEGIDLQDRHGHPREKLRQQQEPARKRADEERPHRPGLAVIDHREGGLHAVEELDHRDEAGGDVDLVEDVGDIGRRDREAEHRPETRREDEEPDERTDERREEPLALAQEPQRLAPDDAPEGARAPPPAEIAEAHGVSISRSMPVIARTLSARPRSPAMALAR